MDARGNRYIRPFLAWAVLRAGVIARGLFVLVLIALFVFPVPPQLLDLLIVANIAAALVLLLRSLTMQTAQALLLFPTVLLLTTLFRLGLNVASTRLILLHGDTGLDAAGRVIEAFGRFVVQGDFLVGAIIFAVITIVNFIVIARGSARVAEVAARFALDALPGRQLAIDADVRSGTISQEQASRLRTRLQQESQFYGAMDGAMRFVQGDAIAGLVITFINAIGGVSIGVNRGLAIDEAIGLYGVLTIGDGLVTILPALLISVCAGIVVTHVTRTEYQGQGDQHHLREGWAEPQALGLSALTLLLIGLVPGFPLFPFALGTGGIALLWLYTVRQQQPGRLPSMLLTVASSGGGGSWTESSALLQVGPHGAIEWSGSLPSDKEFLLAPEKSVDGVERSPMNIKLCVQLHPESALVGELSSTNARMRFLQRWQVAVAELQKTAPIHVPAITLVLDSQADSERVAITFQGDTIGQFSWISGQRYLIGDLQLARVLGAQFSILSHPSTGQAIGMAQQSDIAEPLLLTAGVEVCDGVGALTLHAMATVRELLPQLLHIDDVKLLTAIERKSHPLLVDEVFQRGMTYPELTVLLRGLLEEHVPLAHLQPALDAISQFQVEHPIPAGDEKKEWLVQLSDRVRNAYRRSIAGTLARAGRPTGVLVLSAELSEEIEAQVAQDVAGNDGVDVELDERLRLAVERWCDPRLQYGESPLVIACPKIIRRSVSRILRNYRPAPNWLRVVSLDELAGLTNITTIGIFDREASAT